MSSRPLIPSYQVITNGDMSSNITSKVTIIDNLSMMSYSYVWTGAPTGTIQIQVSNDYKLNSAGTGVLNPGTWTALTFSVNGTTTNSIAVTGTSGSGFADIDQIGAYAIRTVYTAASGSGTLNSFYNAKVS